MPDAALPMRVAVVGAGWAGCAAAVTLARAGLPVTLIEQARILGGRARRVELDGVAVDNGQHLLIGAYRATLDLVALVHGKRRGAAQFHRLPLSLHPFGLRRPGAAAFAAWPLPAPLHLAAALLTARGLSLRDRLALVVAFRDLARSTVRSRPDETLAVRLERATLTVVRAFWDPLCLAALNTPPERASANVFARIVREAFAGPAGNSDFLVPAVDLSACFPEAAARFVTERGGTVRSGAAVRAIEHVDTGVVVRTHDTTEAYAAAIVAVGPHQLRTALGPAADDSIWREPMTRVDAFSYESITTVYLRFAAPLPMRAPLLRLDDAPGQWIFRHRAPNSASTEEPGGPLYAVVISAGGAHDNMGHVDLASTVERQLRRLAPELPAVLWSRVIAERRATYACTPNLARPVTGCIAPRLYLAGDYTEPDLPATLEAATRSGVAAARSLVEDARSGFARAP